jgi:hypothetical protein
LVSYSSNPSTSDDRVKWQFGNLGFFFFFKHRNIRKCFLF